MIHLRTGALAVLTAAAACSPASAAVPHTVQPGETLWSIAAASNLTNNALAAANGLSADSQVVLGSTIQIPSEAEAAAALAGGGGTAAPTATAGQADPAAPEPLGGYTVQPGETLSGIAANAGTSAEQLAWMNGLDPAGTLLAGTALKLPGPTETQASAPQTVPDAAPYASPGHTNSAEVSQIAAEHGVSGSLASAIAYQESGFNNGVVSSANARGVMQVMPGTWDWIENNLSGPLDPASTQDNVRAGSLYLRQLLQDTGGDERTAVAAYYQGLGSVQSQGLLPETERYVENVMALKGRFGG